MKNLRDLLVLCFSIVLAPVALCKEPLNITCTLDPMQITVEIFTTRPLFSVQLKNADKSCDPQEFTENSIKFSIQNYQIGMCGFVRSESSTNGMDGTFWNNLIWKEKPTAKTTKTTKIKCAQKLSSIFGPHRAGGAASMPIRIQVIHLPFGAFPSAFGGQGLPSGMPPGLESVPQGLSALPQGDPMGLRSSGLPPGLMSPFPPGINPMSSGMIMLRSGHMPFGGLSLGGPSASPEKTESGIKPDSTITLRSGGIQFDPNISIRSREMNRPEPNPTISIGSFQPDSTISMRSGGYQLPIIRRKK